jgi:hypothetical protein
MLMISGGGFHGMFENKGLRGDKDNPVLTGILGTTSQMA